MIRTKVKFEHSWRYGILVFAFFLCFSNFVFARSIVPPHEVIHTKNGAEIYFFPSEKIPLFQIELVFDVGSAVDPEGRSGLASMTMSMLRRGILGMDEDSISRKMDDLAAGIEFSAQDEDVAASAYGLNEHADEIVDLLFKQLKNPTFPEKPFRRLRDNHLDAVSQLKDSASTLATHVLSTVVYNKTIYARPSGGLKKDFERITLSDVRRYYSKLIRTDGLKVLVIGGKTRAEVADLVVRQIEALPCAECGKPRPKVKVRDYPKWHVPPGHVVVVNRPGIAETHVRMGFLGPKRATPEYYDLSVAETILGGTFSSLLNEVIREKLNLTYGIGADFRFGWKIGSFTISTSTRTPKTGELITEVHKLLRAFASHGPTDQELKMAKDYLIGSFPLSLQNLYAIAAAFFNGRINGLPADFLDAYQARIEAVSDASLRAAVQKYFKLDQLVTVVSGDAAAIRKELDRHHIKYVQRDIVDFL